MAIKTLISPNEVVQKMHGDHNMDPQLVCSHITKAEFRYLESDEACFGSDFYAALLANAVTFTDYDSTVVYALNAIVIYDGSYYKCLANGTTGFAPTDVTKWVKVSKFANADYQELWDDYLWQYLSLAIQHTSTFKNAYRTTSQGIMRNETPHSKSAEYAGVKGLKDELMDDLNVLFKRMDKYLKANRVKFPLYKANADACEDIKCSADSGPSFGLYLKKSKTESCNCSEE